MAHYRLECKHPDCKRSFESSDSMNQHYLASHSQAEKLKEKYACDSCNKSFRKIEGLQDHMRSRHLTTYNSYAAITIAPPVLPSDQFDSLHTLACNDCGKAHFKSADALHQHQWASANHTCVSKSPNPNHGTRVRTCSQCYMKLPTAEDLEQHFVNEHPISEVLQYGEERTWQQVEERFRSAWIKPTIKLYEVHRIFKVYNPGWRRTLFKVYNPGWRRTLLEEYRNKIKTEMSNEKLIKEDDVELRNRVRSNGNELERYHGTTVSCRLGRPPKPKDTGGEALSLCTDEECSLCRIMQTGFKKSKCRIKFQRFGKGIYCSSASSKASAYVKCSESDQNQSNFNCFGCFGDDESPSGKGNYKVMMVCRVIAGRPHHTTCDLKNLKGPPRGFHSVQGNPGERLNYDELVVYDDHAILPAYIILYSSSD